MQSTSFVKKKVADFNKNDDLQIDPDLKVIDKNDDEYLLFSPFNQKIIKIEKRKFDKLQDPNTKKEKLRKEAIKEGVFTKKNPKFNYKNDQNSIIIVFSGCNSDCKYCYLNNEFKKFDFGFLKEAILKFTSQKNNNFIGFHGGETKYSKKIIKKIVNLISGKRKDLKFSLQTNGVISKSFTHWANKNIDTIVVSSDGPADIQNNFRPLKGGRSSFEIVDRTIDLIDKEKLATHTVVTNENISRIQETIDYFSKKGVKKIEFAPVKKSKKTIKNNIKIDLEEYSLRVLEAIKNNKDKNFKLFFGGHFNTRVSDVACMACHENYYALHPKKSVRKCLKSEAKNFFEVNEKNKEIRIDKDKVEKFHSRNVQNIPACQDCFLKFNCAGYCPLSNYQYTGSIYNPNSEICNYIKEMNRELMIFKAKKEINYKEKRSKKLIRESKKFLFKIKETFDKEEIERIKKSIDLISNNLDNIDPYFKKVERVIDFLISVIFQNPEENTFYCFSENYFNLVLHLNYTKKRKDFILKLVLAIKNIKLQRKLLK